MDKGGRRGPSHWTNPPSIPWTAAASTVPDDLASGSLQSVARVRPLGRQRKHLNLQPGQAKGGGRRRQCLWFRSHVDRLFEAQAAPAMAARGKPRVADAGLAELAGLPALPTGMVLRATCPPRPRSRCKQQQSPTVTGMIVVANKPIPVIPDTGTEKAARLATELTGNPGCWVRLDCGHPRHVQQPVPARAMLDCPTCPPPRPGPGIRAPLQPAACRRFPSRSHGAAAGRRGRDRRRPPRRPRGCRTADRGAGGQRRAPHRGPEAPLELTIDAHDDVVRVEVHDQAPRVALGLEEHPAVRSGALGPVATDSSHPWRAERPGGGHKVVWAELHAGDGG
jgi:hypothetical protein